MEWNGWVGWDSRAAVLRCISVVGQTDRQTDRQTGRQAGRQAGSPTGGESSETRWVWSRRLFVVVSEAGLMGGFCWWGDF